jgi:putative membrane protein
MASTTDSHMAWMRTRFALDRTFMAWLRTAAAMIGFGFTIVEAFAQISKLKDLAPANLPTVLGLSLIGTGVISLAIAFAQYRVSVRHLHQAEFAALAVEDPRSPAWLTAVALLATGAIAFVTVLARALL